ncbi:MAG: hypothetical protein ACRDSM_21730, partial [Pseudonocardiaceae bacterium]
MECLVGHHTPVVGNRPKPWEINCGRPVVLRRRQVRISASAGDVPLAELHEVLQVRTRILNDDLADDFARWHP